MSFDFKLPDLGEGIVEAEIVKWLVKDGDVVEEHEAILELETAKAVVQVPSPKAGTVLKIFGSAGDKIHVGDVLCTIGEAGETTRAPAGVMGELETAPEEPKFVAPKKVAEPSVAVLPAIRKLAQELKVDVSKVQGSGPGGRITEDDVARASTKKDAGPTITFEKFGRVIKLPLKGVRKEIAVRLSESMRTTVQVTHMDYADVTKLADYREKEKEEAEKRGVKLTFMPFIVKACVLGLKAFPYVNSSLDGNDIVIKQYYNIGVAVDTPAGLMVPVVKNANERTIYEISREIYRVAELSRTREIQLKDLQGGTFTVTNIGSLGGVFATPVINYPECAILGLGRIADMAVPINGKVEIRKMLPLSLSFDHRIIDGAMAAKFVNEIKRHLEDPDALLMGY
ncbi:MAG: dihydrolipoamide acetyltransferase family protein [Candidatus Woesearchaeota archaeon]|nr:dihydrolipoamide acetyltransferase family protein [Candidatus Woesearchaeota archaeon]